LRRAFIIEAMKMEAVSTSETSVNFYQAARGNNPKDSHIHTRRRENLKSHIFLFSQVYASSNSIIEYARLPFAVLFVVYLMTLSVAQTIQRRLIG
jgi:hypothetical protein